MGSWYILITKLYESLQAERARRRGAQRSSSSRSRCSEGAEALKKGSAFRFIADSGIEASEHHEGALTENIDHNSWVSMSVQRSIDDIQSRLQDGLAFLATVGSTAPFVGLFGTVWGIYHALTAIGIAGQASIDKVAGPVGEALIMTAIGLAVAVPAVLGYNWLVRRNKVDDGVGAPLRRRPARRADGCAHRPRRRRAEAAEEHAMAMNVGAADGDEDEVVSTINTTPLVDVMLVLLIIFLITIPVVTQTIPVPLPKETNIARQTKPENIDISVNKDGDIFWNQTLVPDTDALFQRLSKIAMMKPQPEVHIRGDGQARYESIGRVALPVHAGVDPEGQLRHRTAAEGLRERTMAMNVGTSSGRRARRDDGHQHHAADRRDAGADHHADHHDPDAAALGQPQHAGRQRRRRRRRSRWS